MVIPDSYLSVESNGLAGSVDNCLWRSLEGQMHCGLLKGSVDSIAIRWFTTGKAGEA